jgi:adenylate kinase
MSIYTGTNSSAWNIIILGPIGSGKGTQAGLLAKYFGMVELGMGQLLRMAAKEATDTGRTIDRIVNREFGLVPFEIAMGIFRHAVALTPPNIDIVYDGTPRQDTEVDYWDEELPKLGRAFSHLFVLRVSARTITQRLTLRRVCSVKGTPFTLGVSIQNDSNPCPCCGAQLIQRPDDTPKGIRKRLRIYEKLTAPVIERYRPRGIVHEINAEQTPNAIAADIKAILLPQDTGMTA